MSDGKADTCVSNKQITFVDMTDAYLCIPIFLLEMYSNLKETTDLSVMEITIHCSPIPSVDIKKPTTSISFLLKMCFRGDAV